MGPEPSTSKEKDLKNVDFSLLGFEAMMLYATTRKHYLLHYFFIFSVVCLVFSVSVFCRYIYL